MPRDVSTLILRDFADLPAKIFELTGVVYGCQLGVDESDQTTDKDRRDDKQKDEIKLAGGEKMQGIDSGAYRRDLQNRASFQTRQSDSGVVKTCRY